MKRPLNTKRKFFLRRALIFSAVMMIPTLLVGLFSLYVTINRTEREIDQQGRGTVLAVETNSRLIVANVFTQNDLLTGTTRMSMSLHRSLFSKELSYSDALFLSSLHSALRSVVNTHSYIDSIYLYLDGGTRFFTSAQGMTELSGAKDANWLDVYRLMNAEQDELACLRRGPYGKNVLTFIKRTLMQQGCAVVNIDVENLEEILQTLLTRPCETITLLNADGTILLQTSNSPWALPTQADFNVLRASGASDGQWVRGRERTYYHNSGAFENAIVYASVDRTVLFEQASRYLNLLGWMMLINIAVVLLLAYITTRRSFVQIGSMIDTFERAENGEPIRKPEPRIHDEYDVVMNNIIYMYLKQNELRSQLQARQIGQEHAELMALQLQINPHFLFNTLQTLEMDIRGGRSNSEDASELVRRISEILRYALGDPHETVPLSEELEYLRKYAAVQAYRFGERFVLYFEAEDGLENARVFRLMLQPLVENSLIHGLRGVEGRMYIWVRAEREGERIHFTISDTGAGMTEEQLEALLSTIHDEKSRSIGLTNLNRRLMLQYGEESALHIQSSPGQGTEIRFTIPCRLA